MNDYLVQHAIDNVWCNPEVDKQFILVAQKLTQSYGALNYMRWLERRLNMPKRGKRYHVYNVGQIHPSIIGLLAMRPEWAYERWVSFAEAVNEIKLFANIYTTYGVCLPLFKSYYMFTNERDLVFAIEIDPNYSLSYEDDTIYTRLYSNGYFRTQRSTPSVDLLHCEGRDVEDLQHILEIQTLVNFYRAKPGHTFVYINGQLRADVTPLNTNPGDTIEFIYDSSVKRLVTFTVRDLPTFTSTLDSKHKYLLHHLSGTNDTIDFQDDLEIYITYPLSTGGKMGRYYHRNQINAHRMVTHRDYSVVVDYFTSIANELADFISPLSPLDLMDFRFEVAVREPTYRRPLVFDDYRIFELYKLNNDDILDAMVGLDSTVPFWRAEVLEASAYTELMRARENDIDIDLVQRAYGYNAISKLIGETPTKTTIDSGLQTAKLPVSLWDSATVYEYDEDGKLLGHFYHTNGENYRAFYPATRLVEVISGQGTERTGAVFGEDLLPIPEIGSWRVYRCFTVNGVPDNIWQDVTDSGEYTVIDHVIHWANPPVGQWLMVRTDKTFLTQDLQLNMIAGTLYFSIAEEVDLGSGYVRQVLPVPMGDLDIFLNGKALIKGLDYIIKFPMVHIISKRHILQPAGSRLQNIHVRFTGFCKSDLSMEEIDDHGFVEHGFLSNNNRFDIRDDKVLRITVNGETRHRDDLEFSEDHSGIQVVHARNGQPYQIKDIVVPLKDYTTRETYEMRAESEVIDQIVSDYMTLKLPQPERSHPSAIPERYPLLSPFLSHLINDMESGQFDDSSIDRVMTDNDVLEVCEPFEFLLDFDPITYLPEIDRRFTIIHPHNLYRTIELNVFQYRFILRVVALYGQGLVELSPFVTVNNP